MLVLAADHAIQDIEAFHAAVLAAEQESVDNKLVTFGIVPTKPETGYGYIKKGEQVKNSVFKVNSFVEKPDLETAKIISNKNAICGIVVCSCSRRAYI